MGRSPYDGSMQRNRRGRPRHPDVLTPAEWRVLDALRDGGTNAEIAARLGLSPDTVKTHVSNMLAKLELRDRRALAAWRPEERRGRLGAVLAVPAVLWAVVGRPLVWVGMGTVAVAGAVVAVVAAAGVVVAVVVLASGDSDASPFATPAVVATAQGEPGPAVSCESGIAVTNPATKTELVADCESLLGLRDTIRGTARLNWTAGKAMTDWMGVTVSGTPQRVTALNLADLGLNGELSGLLGNLTGLTTLDLSGNVLTGMLPSKLTLLTSLTTVSISGTSFTGCAPEEFRDVATSDVSLDDCGEPTELHNIYESERVLPQGTYRVPYGPWHAPLIFDVPAGEQMTFDGVWIAAEVAGLGSGGPIGVLLGDASGNASIGLDLMYATEWSRNIFPAFTGSREEISELLDRIVESLWLEESE